MRMRLATRAGCALLVAVMLTACDIVGFLGDVRQVEEVVVANTSAADLVVEVVEESEEPRFYGAPAGMTVPVDSIGHATNTLAERITVLDPSCAVVGSIELGSRLSGGVMTIGADMALSYDDGYTTQSPTYPEDKGQESCQEAAAMLPLASPARRRSTRKPCRRKRLAGQLGCSPVPALFRRPRVMPGGTCSSTRAPNA